MGVKEWIGERKKEFKESREKKRIENTEYNKAYDEAYRKGRLVRARKEGFKRGRQTGGGGFLSGFQPFMETMGRAGRNVGMEADRSFGFGMGSRPKRVHHRKSYRKSQPQVIIIGGSPRRSHRRSRRPSRVEYY